MKNTTKTLIISLFIALLPSLVFASFDTNLRYGSRGEKVSELQEFLISEGFMTVSATGNFYSLTLKAVKAFQTAHNLPSTGFFGIMSRTVANSLITQDEDIFGGVEATSTPVIPIAEQKTKELETKIDNLTQQVQILSIPQPVQVIQPSPVPPIIDKTELIIGDNGVQLSPYTAWTSFTLDTKDKDGNQFDWRREKVENYPNIHIVATLDGQPLDDITNTDKGYPYSQNQYNPILKQKGTYTFTFTYGNLTKSETIEVK